MNNGLNVTTDVRVTLDYDSIMLLLVLGVALILVFFFCKKLFA